MSKLTKTSEQIAISFEDWLKAEVVTSGEGRNKYLDGSDDDQEKAELKFQDVKNRLALPYDDETNWASQKDRGHQQQRVPHWVDAFEASVNSPEADYYAAQAMFAPLMTASGSYRAQCYLLTTNPAEYAELRARGSGIDLEGAIFKQLQDREVALGFTAAEISFSGLREAFRYKYAQTELYFRGISARLRKGLEEYRNDSLSVRSMKKSQINHVRLATDCVIMAAKLRKGNLEAVPFLEPVSITDQSNLTHYPLHERIDWLEVLGRS